LFIGDDKIFYQFVGEKYLLLLLFEQVVYKNKLKVILKPLRQSGDINEVIAYNHLGIKSTQIFFNPLL